MSSRDALQPDAAYHCHSRQPAEVLDVQARHTANAVPSPGRALPCQGLSFSLTWTILFGTASHAVEFDTQTLQAGRSYVVQMQRCARRHA